MFSVKRSISMTIGAIGAASLLSGCQGIVQKPVVHVTGITYANITKTAQTVGVRLDVKNPNIFSIPIQSGSAQVAIDGRPFAHGVIPHAVTLPAGGGIYITVPIQTNATVLEKDLPLILLDGGIRYQVTGHVSVPDHDRNYPFTYQGTLTWGQAKQIIAHEMRRPT